MFIYPFSTRQNQRINVCSCDPDIDVLHYKSVITLSLLI
jgi:hypothetical protein